MIEALKLMNNGKTAEPSGITVELMKVCEKECVKRLIKVAKDMLNGKKMPESWKKSDLIPIYEGKGDERACGNYRSVKLLQHGMKVIKTMFEKRLRRVVKQDEMQMGLMLGKGTIDAIFIIR